jgi:fructose-bisphosphate aldolase, class II
MDELSVLIRTLAEKAAVPVLMHQDHPGKDSNIFRSLRRGYYSVMFDGGHLPLAENTRLAQISPALLGISLPTSIQRPDYRS